MSKVISNTFSVNTVVDGQSPNVNMLLRTVFDNGLDFIHEKWDAQHWSWVLMDSSPDAQYIEGHQSIRIVVPAGVDNDTMFYQNVLGKLKANTWYTFSFNLFASKDITFCIHNVIGGTYTNLYANNKVIVDGVEVTPLGNHYDVQLNVPEGGTLWDGKRHYITFKTNNDVATSTSDTLIIGWYFLNQSASVEQNFVLCMPKLEEGEFATSYMSNEDDLVGQRGKTGRFFYYAGEFDSNNSTDTFLVNDAQSPYFKTGNSYHVFNYDVNGSYTMAQMYAIQSDFNYAPWSVMTSDFKYLITEALFGGYAHLGSAIINGDWMISTNGSINGVLYNNGELYPATGDNRKPAYMYFDPLLLDSETTIMSQKAMESDGTDYYTSAVFSLIGGREYTFNAYATITQGRSGDRLYIALIKVEGQQETTVGSAYIEYDSSYTSVARLITLTYSTPSNGGSYYIKTYLYHAEDGGVQHFLLGQTDSVTVKCSDAFIPNYAVDLLRGSVKLSGDITATKVVASNEQYTTEITPQKTTFTSIANPLASIVIGADNDGMFFKMTDKDGRTIWEISTNGSGKLQSGGGDYTQAWYKWLGTSTPTNLDAYKVRYIRRADCSQYYRYNGAWTIVGGVRTFNSGEDVKDGVYRINASQSSSLIPEGWYAEENNGIYKTTAPSSQQREGVYEQIGYVPAYHFDSSGKIDNTVTIEVRQSTET